MLGQHRQQNRAQHVPLGGRVRARQMQRAARHKAVEQPRLLQVLDEERQLAHRRHRRRWLPLQVNPARKGLRCHRTFDRRLYRQLLTRRVNHRNLQIVCHLPSLPAKPHHWQPRNCRI